MGVSCQKPGTGVRVLLLTPPFVQLNTPYPATAQLTGWLRRHGVAAVQPTKGENPALCHLFVDIGARDKEEAMTMVQPGDVCVIHEKNGSQHTGIYIGDGQMVHAADEATGVVVSNVQDGMIFVRY